MTDQQRSNPPTRGRTPLRVCPLKVVRFAGRDDEIALSLAKVPGGNGVMAQAEAEGEKLVAVFMGELNLMVSDGHGGIQTAADGMGMLGLTNQRAFGLLMDGEGLGKRCTVDARGNGHVVVYTIDRSLFVKHKAVEGGGFRKKTKAVSLIGKICALSLGATARLGPGGRFEKSTSDELLNSVRGWLA